MNFNRYFFSISSVWIFAFFSLSASAESAIANPLKGSTLLLSMRGLKLPEITTRDHLNEAEDSNIQKAYSKYFAKKNHPKLWFNENFLVKIHKDMFCDIWEWAGIYYIGSQRNIGVVFYEISEHMQNLCKEVQEWLAGKTDLDDLQQSARILHRIMQIHPFTNGNGRYARFVSNLYLYSLNGSRPYWPDKALLDDGIERQLLLQALKSGDQGDFALLEKLIVEYGGRHALFINPSIF